MSALLWIFAVANVANGLWMLFDPAGCMSACRLRCPTRGRSTRTGCATSALRSASAASVSVGVRRISSVLCRCSSASRFFYGGHAITHVADIVEGRLPPSHWLIDTPLVFAPTIMLVVMGAWLARRGN